MNVREKLVEWFYENNVRCDQKIEGLVDDVIDIIDNGVTVQTNAEEPKMRLIDADSLIKEANADGAYGYVDAKQIADAPTIAAVPVVRCKDCKFGDWDSEPHDAIVCMRTKDGFWRSGNDFCSYGERRC